MPEKLLEKVGAILESLRVPYMIVGSFASSSHGIPRSTNDLDVVIDPTPEGFAALLEQFPDASYHLSREAARDALSAMGQFHVVEYATGWRWISFSAKRTTTAAKRSRGDLRPRCWE